MRSTTGGREFLDPNLLVYAHDRGQREKHKRAKALVSRPWHERSGVLSTQVVQEVPDSQLHFVRLRLESDTRSIRCHVRLAAAHCHLCTAGKVD